MQLKKCYEAPATTVVEMKMETGILVTSTMRVILGLESGFAPSDYGLQDYTWNNVTEE
jgi:hypothetical protein